VKKYANKYIWWFSSKIKHRMVIKADLVEKAPPSFGCWWIAASHLNTQMETYPHIKRLVELAPIMMDMIVLTVGISLVNKYHNNDRCAHTYIYNYIYIYA